MKKRMKNRIEAQFRPTGRRSLFRGRPSVLWEGESVLRFASVLCGPGAETERIEAVAEKLHLSLEAYRTMRELLLARADISTLTKILLREGFIKATSIVKRRKSGEAPFLHVVIYLTLFREAMVLAKPGYSEWGWARDPKRQPSRKIRDDEPKWLADELADDDPPDEVNRTPTKFEKLAVVFLRWCDEDVREIWGKGSTQRAQALYLSKLQNMFKPRARKGNRTPRKPRRGSIKA